METRTDSGLAATACVKPTRLRVQVSGAVQGVGFRPFVHRLATRYKLAGFVLNDCDGVLLEVEGRDVDDFVEALAHEQPPLARVDGLKVTAVPFQGSRDFEIRESHTGAPRTRMVPDAATCDACIKDLFDPTSRFYLYPFVTCTHCGPRFTITRRLPYDRPQTTMSAFAPCGACAQDYRDPSNRRFHAEAIACGVCGPRLSHPIDGIADALKDGRIVAVKGIGGFHLMCDAHNETAVAELRRRKRRESKPFAVMADGASVDLIAAPTVAERTLLHLSARPVVVMRRGPVLLAPSVAPGLDRIGVMLAHAPVHHLLLRALGGDQTALVATSANFGGEPLVIDDGEACHRLAGIADLIVTHDRGIAVRADDSVMACIDHAPVYLRRARGFVPEPIELREDGPSTLGVGGLLKATVTVTRGREAFVSQHIGDLDTAATIRLYEETTRRLLENLGVALEAIGCDLHPDLPSTRFSAHLADAAGVPVFAVQHHAAHLDAVVAEQQLRGPMIGVALDGHGQGDDGGAWGGELMRLDGSKWRRLGHLAPLDLPGGDRAALEPWRMGVAALIALGRAGEAAGRFPEIELADTLARAWSRPGGGTTTTSMGRLFDAASALLGLRTHQSYEGQAAMELEALVRVPRCLFGGYRIDAGVLDFRPLLAALPDLNGDPCLGAELFHGTLVEGLTAWVVEAASPDGLTQVAFGGGCFMNRVLTEGLAAALRARGMTPWLPRAVPANDGGLSLGQAYAARRSASLPHSQTASNRMPMDPGRSRPGSEAHPDTPTSNDMHGAFDHG
ncbi:MAG: carbamoyltransferase HypF [Methylocella sp.]